MENNKELESVHVLTVDEMPMHTFALPTEEQNKESYHMMTADEMPTHTFALPSKLDKEGI